MRHLIAFALAISTIVAGATVASAHGGGTNSQGCHNETKTGGYHCH
ncbi:MAG: YHYH domain-containing protein [Mesorhizobium sp.]|nr:MAG: YHYH domain-containing protein [Mesorhizobium sp.]